MKKQRLKEVMTLAPGQSAGKRRAAGEILVYDLQVLLLAEQEKTQALAQHPSHQLTAMQVTGPGPQLGETPILRSQPWFRKTPDS